MSDPQPTRPTAFATAQNAFANGWIDLADLDRRLAAIAEAPDEDTAQEVVADLSEVGRRVQLHQGSTPSMPLPAPARHHTGAGEVSRKASGVPFFMVATATVISLVVWSIIAITNGPQDFWPIWMLIPLTATGAIWIGGRFIFPRD
ncbi:hypothetical protein [Corynebacterium sp. A21]|uniref:hypothetical protein n=1 Tax=Corynebacterium sp. A21 TaxID=3457318 RepID=UPI003FD24998